MTYIEVYISVISTGSEDMGVAGCKGARLVIRPVLIAWMTARYIDNNILLIHLQI